MVARFLVALSILFSTSMAQARPHDCAIFYMGTGGQLFAGALQWLADAFQGENPNAYVEIRHHWDRRSVPEFCRNPLLVGHSMGAVRAVAIGNATGFGRVITIDPPNFLSLDSDLPTVNFYIRGDWLGGGTVRGACNVNLACHGLSHISLPSSCEVYWEVLKIPYF
jgi:hypothetical protein